MSRRPGRTLASVALLGLTACPTPDEPARSTSGAGPESPTATADDLERDHALAYLDGTFVVQGSSPSESTARTELPCAASWERSKEAPQPNVWEADLPAGWSPTDPPSTLGDRVLLGAAGQPLRYGHKLDVPGTWAVAHKRLRLRTRPGEAPVCTLDQTREAALDASLHRDTATTDDRAFVLRRIELDGETHQGVYLPAPSSGTWSLTLPAKAALDLQAILLPAPAGATATDGADLVVEVLTDGGGATEVLRAPVGLLWSQVHADLARWAGQRVQLRLRTEAGAGGSNAHDHVFLAAPLVHGGERLGRRFVWVFVDTLRRDHLGLYGYERPTTPRLDAWAQGAAVFDMARSVAPWTQPTVFAMVTGRQPERWKDVPTLAETLGRAGFVTWLVPGSVRLMHHTGFDRGFARSLDALGQRFHGAEGHLAKAQELLAQAPADADVFLMVHLMDAHLPYAEPEPHRSLWQHGPAPAGLEDPIRRRDLTPVAAQVKRKVLAEADVKAYLIDRYDQSIHYVDTALDGFLAALDPAATVLVMSDHGEEFFDHGWLEHGHALYDELLRVPLLVKGPGVVARRVPEPVSLLDLTPTVLEWLGVPGPELEGVSLAPLLRGSDPALQARLDQRHQLIGRLLYGNPQWGAVHQGRKWIHDGDGLLAFDLGADPLEQADLVRAGQADPAAFDQVMQAAAPSESELVWALTLRGPRERAPELQIRVDGGFTRAWAHSNPYSLEPKEIGSATLEGDALVVHPGPAGLPTVVYALPGHAAAAEPTVSAAGRPLPAAKASPGPHRVWAGKSGELSVIIERLWLPTFHDDVPYAELDGDRGDLSQELRALGYVE